MLFPLRNTSNRLLTTFALISLVNTTRCLSSVSIPAKTAMMNAASAVTYVNADVAKLIDDRLMETPGFSIDQLMELAGYSVASAAHDYYINFLSTPQDVNSANRNVLILCGPGNNGGDGLVSARHLKHFGYNPRIIYPKRSRGILFENLVKQCKDLDIPVEEAPPVNSEYGKYSLIIDALFGFSFKGPVRAPFIDILQQLATTSTHVLSVDLPSGWDVNRGDIDATNFNPKAVISLTLPKLCMKNYSGVHYVGGRFMPPSLAQELQLTMPDYGFGDNQIVQLINDECKQQSSESGETIVAMFVTASSDSEAEKIAQHLVSKHLIACANILPGVKSVYEWKGKVEQSNEVLLMIKTQKHLANEVTNEIKAIHSYDLPESIVVDISGAGSNPDYLTWVRDVTSIQNRSNK